MNDAEILLQTLVKAAEGTRKDGFDEGGVAFSLNQTGDTITGTFTIPVTITTNVDGALVVAAQDFLLSQA